MSKILSAVKNENSYVYEDLLSQIIRTHFKSLLWIAAIQLGIEIGNYFLMDSAGLITNTVAEYIIFFILVPTIINALTIFATVWMLKRTKRVVNGGRVVSFASLIIFSNIYFCHNLFRVLFMVYFIAIMVSIVYSDKMLTIILGITSVCLKTIVEVMLISKPFYDMYGVHIEASSVDIFNGIIFAICVAFATVLCVLMIDIENRKENMNVMSYDALTGIYNRKSTLEYMGRKIGVGGNGVVLMLDLDGFKSVNDKLGHPFGDVVLKETAEIIKLFFRENDCVGRLGGDEFMVIAPEITMELMEKRAEKLIQDLTKEYEDPNGGIVKVCASVGLADYPKCGSTVDEVYRMADTALYDAKNAGKGQYKIATTEV